MILAWAIIAGAAAFGLALWLTPLLVRRNHRGASASRALIASRADRARTWRTNYYKRGIWPLLAIFLLGVIAFFTSVGLRVGGLELPADILVGIAQPVMEIICVVMLVGAGGLIGLDLALRRSFPADRISVVAPRRKPNTQARSPRR